MSHMTELERDAYDAHIVSVGEPGYNPDQFQYYDDMEEYSRLLIDDNREMPQTLHHELSHGICALAESAMEVETHALQLRMCARA